MIQHLCNNCHKPTSNYCQWTLKQIKGEASDWVIRVAHGDVVHLCTTCLKALVATLPDEVAK